MKPKLINSWNIQNYKPSSFKERENSVSGHYFTENKYCRLYSYFMKTKKKSETSVSVYSNGKAYVFTKTDRFPETERSSKIFATKCAKEVIRLESDKKISIGVDFGLPGKDKTVNINPPLKRFKNTWTFKIGKFIRGLF